MPSEQKLEGEAEALSEQLNQYLFRRMEARIPFYTAYEEVFGGPFQLADEARINAIPLHERKPTLQLFVKFTQNLQEELAVCGKHDRVKQLELQFMTKEKTLYENAFRDLLDKLEPQETEAKANANDDRGQQCSKL